MRLQKFMANSGVASRRKSEEIISERRVKVNGNITTDPATDIKDDDIVLVDDVKISLNKNFEYYILNKPYGIVSTAYDNFNRKNVTEFIDTDRRIYPVGRLDIDTTGLILLTDDGEFTNFMTHPKYNQTKTYVALVKGHLTKEDFDVLEAGITIDGYKTHRSELKIVKKYADSSKIEVTISEGRNRQVRKMFDYVGHSVIKLERIRMGIFELGDLEIGEYRKFNEDELKFVKESKCEKFK